MEKLFNLIFPPKCVICNKNFGEVICKKCSLKILEKYEIFSSKCMICDQNSFFGTTHTHCSSSFTPASTLNIYKYKGHIRKIIKDSKYHSKEFITLKYLTRLGIKKSINNGHQIPKHTVVIPIPLSKGREKERGFNQAEIIAKEIAKIFRLKVHTNVLKRLKETQTQHQKNRIARFENLQDAFIIKNKNRIKNRKILLIDDICTTGATLLETSKTLLTFNAAEVRCLTLAKKLLDD